MPFGFTSIENRKNCICNDVSVYSNCDHMFAPTNIYSAVNTTLDDRLKMTEVCLHNWFEGLLYLLRL